MNIKSFLCSSRARIIAAFVSAALVITGLVVWNPLGLSAQAAGGDGSGECNVGETTLKDCFGDASDSIAKAIRKAVNDYDLREDDVLTQYHIDSLRSLTLSSAQHIKNIGKLTNLTTLELDSAAPSNEYDEALSSLTKLTELKLGGSHLAGSGLPSISALRNMSDLTDLELNVYGGDYTFELLAQQNSKLKRLSIKKDKTGNEIYQEWVQDPSGQKPRTNVDWIRGLNNLQEVSLENDGVQDPSALSSLPSLTSLNLNDNHIVDITSLKETIEKLDHFSATDQYSQYPDFLVSEQGSSLRIQTGVVDSNADKYANITYVKPDDGGVIKQDRYAEWPLPKIGRYNLQFNASVGSKGFKFEGAVNQDVKVKVTFFDEYDVKIDNSEQVISSKGPVTFPTVTRKGYDPCWKLGDRNAVDCLLMDHSFDSATYVYLDWRAQKFKVKYVPNNAGDVKSMPADHEADFDSRIAMPGDPSVYGWKFKGWSTTADRTTGLYDFETKVEADVTLYAQWEKVPFKVSFKESAGGKEIAGSQNVLFEDKATNPGAPTKEGHTFKGWVDEAGNLFDFDNTPITKDTVLYPLWDINQYKVQFETGDPKVPNPQQQDVDYNKTASKPEDPSRLGHVLEGWTTDEAGKNAYDFDTPVKADIVLHAKWRKAKVNIDDRTGAPVTKVEVADNGIPAKPKNPTREGYDFVGWSLTPDGSDPWNFDSPVPDNQTIFGVWSQITNPVEFDTQGGSAVPTQNVKYKEYANKPTDPVREGFKFVEWTSDKEGKNAFNISKTPITSKTVVYAQWEKNKYVVDFETGDRDVINPDMQTVEHGGLVKRPADPIRKGHEFIGWTADPEGTIPFDFSTKITTNTKIYAQWKKIGSPVSPNENESSPSLDKAGEPSGNKNNADSSDPAAESQQSLARTGSQILGILGIGVALLAAASVLLVFAKKRHDN